MAEDSSHVHIRQIIQAGCGTDLDEALSQFNYIDEQGRCPLVLVPRSRCSLSVMLKVPSGAAAIVQRFGEDIREFDPGLHFVPAYYRVIFLVTRQSSTYFFSVGNCPTKDNVMVKVELTLVFRVLKPQTFVYSLGATKFDDSLKAVAEEAIRASVRAIKHNQIYELRGSGADQLLKALNKKFEQFGVLFSNATIVNVALPQDLASALQNATTFDAKMRNQIRQQEFQLKLLNDDNDQQLKALNLENERLCAQEVARKDRVIIDLQTRQNEFENKKQFSMIKAQQAASVLKTQSQTALETETLNTKSDMELKVKRTTGEVAARKIEVDQVADTERLQSEAFLIEQTNRAKAILLEAEAESKVYEQMSQRRTYDLQLANVKAMQNMAGKTKVVVSGSAGKTVLGQIMHTVEDKGKRL